ncbi:MAG: CCA tRNA nucleotidyltransferase [Phormidesmis sp. CAN_BIN36]|nr:CCA tRNA nucleotidyltransferase [Phormidesmis sp. CAN_BIN36]
MNHRLDFWQDVLAASFALSPETWPFSLTWLPPSAYLVGGTVRDALLDRSSDYLDLDFVLPTGAVETAQAIARHYRAGFVLLDADRQIARVVFEQGTADFAQQVGPSLDADLRRRDFTVNAIAYNPHTAQLLDPLQGHADLKRGLLRMVCAENLAEDPLRLLRAYRQAAQLGFALEPETQVVIRQLAPKLRQIAAERVQSELNYLLSSDRGTAWLTAAWQDGLLQDWFPSADAQSLTRLLGIDQTTVIFQETWAEFATELFRNIRGGSLVNSSQPEIKASGSTRTWLTIAKLAGLLDSDPQLAEAQLWCLKYSRAEIQAVGTVLRALPRLCAKPLIWTLAEQYFFFKEVGATFPTLAILAIAAGTPLEAIAALITRFLDADDPVAHPVPLLTGQDLMSALRIPAGPMIGQLLAALQLARAEGKVANREDALTLAVDLLKQKATE